jgi:hypothetical protein
MILNSVMSELRPAGSVVDRDGRRGLVRAREPAERHAGDTDRGRDDAERRHRVHVEWITSTVTHTIAAMVTRVDWMMRARSRVTMASLRLGGDDLDGPGGESHAELGLARPVVLEVQDPGVGGWGARVGCLLGALEGRRSEGAVGDTEQET